MKRTIHYIDTAGLSQRQALALIERLKDCIRTGKKLPTMYVVRTEEVEVSNVHMGEQADPPV